MNAWYETLTAPPLTPPNSIFGPVWTILYLMIALAIWLYVRSPAAPCRKATLWILAAHIIANAAWSFLFFGLESPILGMIDILFLDLTCIALIISFNRTSRPAALLMGPYLAWLLFASYLNAGFLILN